MSRTAFWLYLDMVAVFLFGLLMTFAAYRGEVAITVFAGFLTLFWQREFHRDFDRMERLGR